MPGEKTLPAAFRDDDDLEIEFVDDDGAPVEQSAAGAGDDGEDSAEGREPTITKPDGNEPAENPDLVALRAERDMANAARRAAEEERDQARQSATGLQQAQKTIREIATAKTQANSAIGDLKSKINDAEERLVAASKEGDPRAVIKINGEISMMQRRVEQLETELPRLDAKERQIEQQLQQQPQRQQQPQQQQTVGTPRNDKARQWAALNPWMGSAPELGQAVSFLSDQIAKDGLHAEDPAHFAELTKRLKAAFPKLDVRGLAPQKTTPRTPPVQGNKTSASGKTDSRKVRLDSNDAAIMRKWKLDPSNKAAQKHYAQARRDIDAEDATRGSAR